MRKVDKSEAWPYIQAHLGACLDKGFSLRWRKLKIQSGLSPEGGTWDVISASEFSAFQLTSGS